jgi:mRNA-degrading endonuclease RelE of RelBE toxin-antitoxin system
MRNFYFEVKLRKKLSIVFKKDSRRYNILIKKIEEIILSENIDHYKNLRKPFKDFKRVHINTHFVLVFKNDKIKDVIYFFDFDYHNKIYKR